MRICPLPETDHHPGYETTLDNTEQKLNLEQRFGPIFIHFRTKDVFEEGVKDCHLLQKA